MSIVVLTFNRQAELMRTLRGLQALPGNHPVIVVDNGSTDGTADAVTRHFPDMELLRSRRNLGAAGRNLGAAAARTPYLAFSDDDTCWHAGALECAACILDTEPDCAILAAKILVGREQRLDPTCNAMAHSPLPGSPRVGPGLLGFMAGACVVRTEAFRQAGGYWAPFFIGGEESLLALDIVEAGWRIIYAPQIVTHHFPSALRDAPRRQRLLARNAVWTAWMRFPWRQAAAATLTEFNGQGSVAAKSRLLANVLSGLPKVLARRHCISSQLVQWRAMLAKSAIQPARPDRH